LQPRHNRVLHATGNLDRCTKFSELPVALKIMSVTKLCRTQAELILNHVNPNVRGTGEEGGRHRKYKRRKLGGGKAYELSAD
jgi:hypothetical protein